MEKLEKERENNKKQQVIITSCGVLRWLIREAEVELKETSVALDLMGAYEKLWKMRRNIHEIRPQEPLE